MPLPDKVFGLCVLLAAPVCAQSQQAVLTDAAPYVVRQWDTRGGLPQNTVNDIAQTPDGYIWLATFGGLVRFDGLRFTVFSSKAHPGIGSDRALSLAVDSSGRLWAGTDNGLVRYAAGSFTTFTTGDGLPDPLVTDVCVDRFGTVWIATETGLARWSEESKRFRRAGSVRSVTRQIAEDDQGTLWLRTDAGLFRRDGNSQDRFVADERPVAGGRLVSIVGQDREGGLWLTIAGGLVRWHRGRQTRYGIADGVDGSYSRLSQASDGSLWLASPVTGLTRFRPGAAGARVSRFSLPGGARAFNAKAVFVDREGMVWVGTNVEGLLALRPRVFTMLPLAQGGEVSTTAILGDRRGRVWIGANCDRINVLEGGRLRMFRSRVGQSVPCVWSAAEDRSGALWFGTWGDYLYRYQDGRLEHVGASAGLTHDVVLAIHPSSDGTLWIGTLRGGLNRLYRGRISVFDTATGLPSNQVMVVSDARSGGLWIGTTGGLSRFRDGRITTWTTQDGLSHNHVRAVLEDADGTVWIGSYGGGLTRFRGGRFRAITGADGLFDDAVSAIVDDQRGNLWISSNRGIFRVAREDLDAFADGRAPAVHSVAYRAADGLETEETNGGFQPAAWRAGDGRIWFPTIRGVAILDPRAAVRNTVPPRVHIERLVVDGRRVPLDSAVRLPRGSGNVELEYTALSTPAPEAVMFRYRLNGVDRAWVHAGERRVAYYNRLRPGRYEFTVTAANRDGVWNGVGDTLALAIRPPFYGTWWFQLLSGLVLLAALAAGVKFRMTQRSREAEHAFARRLLAGQEAERKRIASELHDSIGQDLLVVKNRAELALRTSDVEGPARDQLRQISHIVSDTLRQTREIAHNLRPAQLDQLGLAAAVRSAVEQVASASGIAFTVDAGPVDGLLAPEAEIGVFRIVQEGMNNILKHAGATAAEIGLQRDNGSVRLVISDNGSGFSRRLTIDPSLGISGIAERVKLMGGTFEVKSAPGSGVTLTISIPTAP